MQTAPPGERWRLNKNSQIPIPGLTVSTSDTNMLISPVRADSFLKARSAGVSANETRITKTEFTDATLFSVAMCTDVAVLILFSNGHTRKTHLFFQLHFQFCRHCFYKLRWTVLKEHLNLTGPSRIQKLLMCPHFSRQTVIFTGSVRNNPLLAPLFLARILLGTSIV